MLFESFVSSRLATSRIAIANMPFADLNVPQGARVSLGELQRSGYGVVAVNVDCESPAKLKEASMVQLLTETVAVKSGKPAKKAKLYTPSATNALQLADGRGKKAVRQVKRITLKLDDIAGAQAMLNSQAVKSFDVVAVEAVSARAFQFACEQADIDLITFDATNRIPFQIKRPWIDAAIKRSIFFEITYTPCLGDSAGRRYFFSNASNLVRHTGGRNLVLSSGAARDILLRSPYDVVNIALLVGMTYAQGLDAISSSSLAVLALAETRRGRTGVSVQMQAEDVSMDD